MTILINQVELNSLEQLSDAVQSIVQLTPDAEQWLQLMMKKQDSKVSFASTSEFVEALALGLRNSSLLRLINTNVTVDVQKLLQFNANDLRDLVHLENQSGEPGPEYKNAVDTMLNKHRMVSNQDLGKISEFRYNNNLNDSPVTWSADFSQQIDLFQILTYCDLFFKNDENEIQKATDWASSRAQNLREFAHFYCLYLSWQTKVAAKLGDLDVALEQITPVLLGALDGPIVTFELDKYALNKAITQWVDAGQTMAFTTLSAGLMNAVLNMPMQNNLDASIEAKQYLENLQLQLTSSLAASTYVNQAGTCRHYQIDMGNRDILLNVDKLGCLSISLDLPKPMANAT